MHIKCWSILNSLHRYLRIGFLMEQPPGEADYDKMMITRGRGYVTRQHKHMAQTKGHVLAHKTWFGHDPASRLEKIEDTKAE